MTFVKVAAALCLVGAALGTTAQAQSEKKDSTARTAGNIVSQPVRDVGIAKTEIPPILVQASDNPYATAGTKTCAQLASSIKPLNDALGADFGVGRDTNEKRASIAETGGRAVVNSLIPFRGVVREVSGAAGAERRLNAAIYAGIARRGYLRGLQTAKGCRR